LVEASKESRQALKVAQDELQALEAQITSLMGVSEKVVMHESLLQLQESRNKSLAVLATLDREANTVAQQLATLEQQINETKLAIAQRVDETASAVVLISTHKTSQAQRQTLNDELQRVSAVAKPTASLDALQADLDKASERQQKLTSMSKGEMPLPKMPGDDELTAEYDTIVVKLAADVGADIKALQDSFEREQGVLKTFASGSCPTCLRPMENFDPSIQGQKIEAARAALQAAIEARTERMVLLTKRKTAVHDDLLKRKSTALVAVNKALVDAKAVCLTASQLLGNARKAEATYTAAQVRKGEIEAALRTVPVISNEAAASAENVVRANTENVSKLTALQTQSSIATAKLASTTQERGRVLAAMPSVEGKGLMTPEEYAEAKQLELQLNKLFTDKRDAETKLGIAQAKLGNQVSTVEQLTVQIEKESKVAAWSKLCGRARDVIHVSGLPTLMMKEYAARINKRVAHYLQIWEADFRLYLDDSLSFRALFDTGHELPAARLSGGQKIVASTSFRLAMSDTFAKSVGLLILDEPTNHLDKDNVVHLQQLLVKLKQMSGASQRQIIIVTHAEQLVGFFDHTIQLAKIG
jgi:DNA repair exonuclease SbcCD ATPase subunit